MKLSNTLLKSFTMGLFILALMMLIFDVEKSDCEEESFFSIHVASFKKLQNANNYVNSMAEKGKMLFWKRTDVPEKGLYYRVYLGKYKEKDKAVEFWKILKEKGSVSYFGIQKFKEKVPEVSESELFYTTEAEEDNISLPGKERFIDNGDGTVTDTKTNLMWVKNGWRMDFFSAVDWRKAKEKCESFKHRGYTDWRLPTLKEWKSLMDKNNEYPALIEPNPFENIIVHMPYWSNTEYNSSQITTVKNPNRAYTVMLYYGRVVHQNVGKLAFVMPVRSLK